MTTILNSKQFAKRLGNDSRFEDLFWQILDMTKAKEKKRNFNPLFYEDAASHSQEVQDLIARYGGSQNKDYHTLDELASGIKNFSRIQYLLFSASSTLKSSDLPDELKQPIIDDIDQYSNVFFGELHNIAYNLRSGFREVGLKPSWYWISLTGKGLRRFVRHDMNGEDIALETTLAKAEAEADGDDNIDIEKKKGQAGIFGLHFKRVAREYLDAQSDDDMKASEVRKQLGEEIDEGNLRYHQDRVHALQSHYDTRIRPIPEIDQDLGNIRSIISASRDILEATMLMTHFYERHVYSEGVNAELLDYKKILNVKSGLEFINDFGIRHVHQLFSYGLDTESKSLREKGYIAYHEVETTPPEAGFHVRPSTYLSKVIQTYGYVSLQLGWTNPEGRRVIWNPTEYDAGSIMQMLSRGNEELDRLKREHPGSDIRVRLKGPINAVDDIKALAEEYSWGEKVHYVDGTDPKKISCIEDIPLPQNRFAYLAEAQNTISKQRKTA